MLFSLERPRKRYKDQSFYVWCPVCESELCRNGNLLLDDELTTWECSNCGTISDWLIEIAGILIRYQAPWGEAIWES